MIDDPAQPAARRHYVFYVRPRCPLCNSLRLHAERSTQSLDGSVTRHSRCLQCGAKLLVVAK